MLLRSYQEIELDFLVVVKMIVPLSVLMVSL
jgi:hypothetical protein